MLYFIYDAHNNTNRQLLATAIALQYQPLDWRNDQVAVSQYIGAGHPSPSGFPSIVDGDSNKIVFISDTFENAIAQLDYDVSLDAASANDKYKIERLKQYQEEGLTEDAWVRAWIQNTEDGDDTELEALRIKRSAVKIKYPKP